MINKFCLGISEAATGGALKEKVFSKVFCKKDFLRNMANVTGKHLCQSLFFNKYQKLLKKRLWHSCFPLNFARFVRKHFYRSLLDNCFLHMTTHVSYVSSEVQDDLFNVACAGINHTPFYETRNHIFAFLLYYPFIKQEILYFLSFFLLSKIS